MRKFGLIALSLVTCSTPPFFLLQTLNLFDRFSQQFKFILCVLLARVSPITVFVAIIEEKTHGFLGDASSLLKDNDLSAAVCNLYYNPLIALDNDKIPFNTLVFYCYFLP